MSKVNLICQKCADHNDGIWISHNNHAQLTLSHCDVCKELTPCVNVFYYKNFKSDTVFKNRLVKKTKKAKSE